MSALSATTLQAICLLALEPGSLVEGGTLALTLLFAGVALALSVHRRTARGLATDPGYAPAFGLWRVHSEDGGTDSAARGSFPQFVRSEGHDTAPLFEAIIDQSCEAITVADLEGNYTFVNSAFCEMIGYSEEELLRMTVFDVKSQSQDTSSFAKSKSSKEGVPFKVFLRRKDGTEFYSEVLGKRIVVEGNQFVLGKIRDITDRLRDEEEKLSLERQLLHAQKLESLGILAGGIAHDFNNLLLTILGNADLALSELPPSSAARGSVREIETASRRAAELARQMLAYSGKGNFVTGPIDLNELIEQTAHLLEVSISKKVQLQYRLGEHLPLVEGDAAQLRQVMMNLIINASEAVGDDNGVVMLATGPLECRREYLDELEVSMQSSTDEPLAEGRYVFVEVTDSGCGMDTETQDRVFDPFFSTKFAGRGLGMSVVQGIVRGHGGAIRIESEQGRGTTFRVLFPEVECAEVCPNSEVAEAPSEVVTPDARGLILMADDEQAILKMGVKMLERLGFDVVIASNGREALDVFRAHSSEVRCVLLDLTMPKMDGEEVFAELQRLAPEIPVILSSGFSESDATQRFDEQGLAGFLQKPYSGAQLHAALRAALHEGD